ncbi:MAG: DivIVA domain-containing protein [Oscillospiraceae bacterium]|nr:DivIVA domain-containing protein [Oscillospiraceae bacterium]
MLTPSDILNRKFEKTAVFGYRPDDVEVFLNEVANDYASLAREKEELEDKLEVLASKLEEYRADEESLRMALLGAQKLGDSIVKESKAKADAILHEATIKSEHALEANQARLEKEKMNLARMQKEVSSFRNRLLAMYKNHLELISALPSSSENTVEKAQAAPSEDAEPIVQEAAPAETVLDEDPAAEAVAEQVAEEEPENGGSDVFEIEPDISEEETKTPRRESRFGQLKFGAGYDLAREDEPTSRGSHSRRR